MFTDFVRRLACFKHACTLQQIDSIYRYVLLLFVGILQFALFAAAVVVFVLDFFAFVVVIVVFFRKRSELNENMYEAIHIQTEIKINIHKLVHVVYKQNESESSRWQSISLSNLYSSLFICVFIAF